LINVAVRVLLDAGGSRVRQGRIAIGPVAPVPFRAKQAESVLTNQLADEETIVAAAQAAATESRPRTSLLRASEEYRRELIRVLTERALRRAIENARG
jgi:CO/xanthine dehydrogenase FAD-binding subunit